MGIEAATCTLPDWEGRCPFGRHRDLQRISPSVSLYCVSGNSSSKRDPGWNNGGGPYWHSF
ncbi:hypothetical protein MOSE0_N13212 [Monosporozyma servazzii]